MGERKADVGMVGLGVMGRNLLLGLTDHGRAGAGFDRDPGQREALVAEGRGHDLRAAADVAELCAQLARPRAIIVLVPAGAVDAVLEELAPRLEPGDVVVDGGNSHYADTERRSAELEARGLSFLGVGISGGAEGARHGASLMAGGTEEGYERVGAMLGEAAAVVDGEPCLAHLGPRSAGHFVKMVHNGIEYGLMELLAECYDVLQRGAGLSSEELTRVFEEWNDGPTAGFLVEITAAIVRKADTSGGSLLERVLDVAEQKGTGAWTSTAAMQRQVAVPTIHAAVAARDLSTARDQRVRAAERFPDPVPRLIGADQGLRDDLRHAYLAASLVTFAQGMALLAKAGPEYGGLDLEAVSRIWRGGCIVRAAVLEDLREAYQRTPALANPLLDPDVARLVASGVPALRELVGAATAAGLPLPAFSASLAYLDGLRSRRLPASLIQAQRDTFGSHGYRRTDVEGVFHSDWLA